MNQLELERRKQRLAIRMIITNARNIMFDDKSDDENDFVVLEKVYNYAETTIPLMTANQFKMHFRMTPETFEDLLRKMHITEMQRNKKASNFPKTELEKEAMVTIWYLSNQESFRSIADRFELSKSVRWDVLYRTCHLLLVNAKFKIVSWPSRERQQEIRRHFQVNEFPGIIGCIDGSHIPIKASKEHPVSYINRKNFHSLLLQGVCDHKKLFIDVYAGQAGSIHDYTMFTRSPLCTSIRTHQISINDDNHIMGDLAYKLETFVLVGYKNHGRLTHRQKNFNYILNKSRVYIENAFALLKGRFRRLKMLETVRLDLISFLIVTACILHNICILNGEMLEDLIEIQEELRQEILLNPRNRPDFVVEEANNNAIIKRNNICNALPIRLRE